MLARLRASLEPIRAAKLAEVERDDAREMIGFGESARSPLARQAIVSSTRSAAPASSHARDRRNRAPQSGEQIGFACSLAAKLLRTLIGGLYFAGPKSLVAMSAPPSTSCSKSSKREREIPGRSAGTLQARFQMGDCL